MSELLNVSDVVEMKRRESDRKPSTAEVAKRMDDQVNLIQALIEAERRSAKAYQETADRRIGMLEEVQAKILRRVLLAAGALIVLTAALAAGMFVLEWIGPTVVRELLRALVASP